MNKNNMNELSKFDNVLIHYPDKNILAIYYGFKDGMYIFKDMHDMFGVTEKYKNEFNIVFEVIEEW